MATVATRRNVRNAARSAPVSAYFPRLVMIRQAGGLKLLEAWHPAVLISGGLSILHRESRLEMVERGRDLPER
jgi:hypothetical protein